MKLRTNLLLTLVVGMLFVQASAMAVSLDPDATLQRPDHAAETDPTDDIAACPLVGTYVEPFNCNTGTHRFVEGMVQELTGVSVSDFGGSATSLMSWANGTFTLTCEWAYAAGDTVPFCNTSGTQPDVGAEFEHRCSISRTTAGVVVCSIRVDPTA